MSPSLLFIIAIALGFTGIVSILSGLIGQPSLEHPTCRRCRRDVRDRAWDESPRCACGAPLTVEGAVRWSGRQRSRSALVAGLLMVLTAGGLTGLELNLRANQLRWDDYIPVSFTLARLRAGDRVESNLRRIARLADLDRLSVATRTEALEAVLALKSGDPQERRITIYRLLSHPSLAAPDTDSAMRLRDRALADLDGTMGWLGAPTADRSSETSSDSGATSAKGASERWLEHEMPVFGWSTRLPPGVIVVLDEIELDGRRVEGMVVTSRNRTRRVHASGPSTEGATFLWPRSASVRMREFHLEPILVPLLASELAQGRAFPPGVPHTERASHHQLSLPEPTTSNVPKGGEDG